MEKIKVLIIDDSALVRKILTEVLSSDPAIEVLGTAMDPLFAVQKIKSLKPDVITLDVEMPRMDGLTFLKKLMKTTPLPVLMISSLTEKGAEVTLRAMEHGAVDFIAKPQNAMSLSELSDEINYKVKAAAQAKRKVGQFQLATSTVQSPEIKPITSQLNTTNKIIAIGSSTGGTVALETLLKSIPLDAPGIVIVQHMPPLFTKSFAERLNQMLPLEVKEAQDGDTITNGKVLVAPGDKHMEVKISGAQYQCRVFNGAPVNRHTPSVSVLFDSVAKFAGKNAVGVMLTGMGEDGSQSMRTMRDAGSQNIVQDEATCVVFGMPKKAIEYGAAHFILPIQVIGSKIIEIMNKMK